MSEYLHQEEIEQLTGRIESIQDYLAQLMMQRDDLMIQAGLDLPEYIFKDPPTSIA